MQAFTNKNRFLKNNLKITKCGYCGFQNIIEYL